MVFRASNVVPQVAYQTVKGAAVQLKLNIDAIVSTLAASNASYDYLRGVYQTLERANTQFNALEATPGLADYAKIQENDPAYDVAAEFIAMQGAITTAITWMQNNVPLTVDVKPVANWGDGNLISTEFTPAQTAGFRTVLATVSAAIS